MTAHLPGAARRHRLVVHKPQEDPRTAHIGRPQRTAEALRAAILKILVARPFMKWELRERLHEPDGYLHKQLVHLRDDGLVRVVGRKVDRRAWALYAWRDPHGKPHPELPEVDRPRMGRREKPPADSWWLVAPDQFAAAARHRAEQARWADKPRDES